MSSVGRRLKSCCLWLVLAIVLVPSVVVMILSFSSDPFIHFPPHTWGLGHYRSVFDTGGVWPGDLRRSFEVAGIVSPVALLIGIAYVLGMQRSRLRGGTAFDLFALGPIIVPGVSYALAMYALMARLHLVGTLTAVVIAHVLLALPFVVLILGSSLSRVGRDYEFAAMSLGATRRRAQIGITLRLMAAGILAAALFAFISSFDEVVFVSFLAGSGFTTVPLEIFNSLRFGVDPAITAISTLLTIFTVGLIGLVTLVRRVGARGAA
ncbi:MAG TPA: ABC transporter permease [Gaiellaceae bacterium]|jgi:ABC-type spermidine/putrescine transport system permease subunit II